MTHEELLAKINAAGAYALQAESYGWIALHAVVELHSPWTINRTYSDTGEKETYLVCSTCFGTDMKPPSYPCPTIQAIEKEIV
jgi:hypothetical protein